MKYKAIISDIDGTITSKTNNDNLHPLPSKKVLSAIIKAKKHIDFVLATSRSLPFNQYLLDYTNFSGPSILLNGALIIDSKTNETLWEKHIGISELFEIVEYLNKKNLSFIIDEKNEIITFSKKYKPKNPLNIFVSELTDRQAKIVEQDLSKISTVALHRVNSWTPTKWGFNISNSQVSKQHAVLEVARILGITTEEIIGIGDGYNDFPLLMACGLKVAMGNAVDELKAIADYIAPPVEEDGVAHVIEKFILGK